MKAKMNRSVFKLRSASGVELSEIILGSGIIRKELENSPDALFDTQLLLRVFLTHLKPPWSSSVKALVDTYTVPSRFLIELAKCKIKMTWSRG